MTTTPASRLERIGATLVGISLVLSYAYIASPLNTRIPLPSVFPFFPNTIFDEIAKQNHVTRPLATRIVEVTTLLAAHGGVLLFWRRAVKAWVPSLAILATVVTYAYALWFSIRGAFIATTSIARSSAPKSYSSADFHTS